MIYVDTGIIIRLIEGTDQAQASIEACLHKIPIQDRILITSRLSLLECRCKPMREKQTRLLDLYDGFFASREIILKEIDAAVVEKATVLRATLGLKTPDTIHAATAILSDTSEFWTTDSDFVKCSELAVEVFSVL